MLWEIDIYPAHGQPDLIGDQVAGDTADLGLAASLAVSAARGYLVQAVSPATWSPIRSGCPWAG